MACRAAQPCIPAELFIGGSPPAKTTIHCSRINHEPSEKSYFPRFLLWTMFSFRFASFLSLRAFCRARSAREAFSVETHARELNRFSITIPIPSGKATLTFFGDRIRNLVVSFGFLLSQSRLNSNPITYILLHFRAGNDCEAQRTGKERFSRRIDRSKCPIDSAARGGQSAGNPAEQQIAGGEKSIHDSAPAASGELNERTIKRNRSAANSFEICAQNHVNGLESLKDELNIITRAKNELEKRLQTTVIEKETIFSSLEEALDRIHTLERQTREQENKLQVIKPADALDFRFFLSLHWQPKRNILMKRIYL